MAQEATCIKGTRHGLIIQLDPNEDFSRVKESLRKKIESARDFFTGASFSIQENTRPLSPAEREELESLCLTFGLISRQEAVADTVPHKTRPLVDNVTPDGVIFTKGLLPKEDNTPCLLMDQGLRSGHRVEYQGHITVMGDVNPGAQLIATGHVLVLGNLRGIAHAGAGGDTKALVAAYRLAAEQLRIAEVVARSPEQKQRGSLIPEIARIRQGRIVVEPF